MTTQPDDASRRRVWIAFAEHFLDTETRWELPGSALVAVQEGFSADEAERIWSDEVWPAVGLNLFSVAGEWAGWDEAWLVSRIEEVRRTSRRRSRSRRRSVVRDRTCDALRGCMDALLAVAPDARRALALELQALGRVYFDFAPDPLDRSTPARSEALRRLFTATFLPLFEPLVVAGAGESRRACREQVERALAGLPPRARPTRTPWWRRLLRLR